MDVYDKLADAAVTKQNIVKYMSRAQEGGLVDGMGLGGIHPRGWREPQFA